jgi:hypothetical protein
MRRQYGRGRGGGRSAQKYACVIAEGVAPRIDVVGLLVVEFDLGLIVLAGLAVMDLTFVRDALVV